MNMARKRAWWVVLLSGIGAILVPKCPACLAAYLSVAGVGVGAAATLAPFIRPLGIAIVTISVAAWALVHFRARHRARACGDRANI